MKRRVVALGTFDGVHLGHQRIIRDAVSYARRHDLLSVVTTFDPHPQQFIVPERGLKLLTTLAERKELLSGLGIDKVKVFRFNRALQRLPYARFVKKCLVDALNARAVFVGFDHAFGCGRSGEVKHLKQLGEKFGFKVMVIRPVKTKGHMIKSSMIRDLIANGEFNRAVHFLGHAYILTGKVVKGVGRGREIGSPTSNLKLDQHKLIPHHGVYLAKALGKKCLVNIGSRPTFGADQMAVEVHIPGFSGNLYGKTLKVELVKKIRDEIQFSDVQDLRERIRKDIAICRRAVI